jgi:hypothetical protein
MTRIGKITAAAGALAAAAAFIAPAGASAQPHCKTVAYMAPGGTWQNPNWDDVAVLTHNTSCIVAVAAGSAAFTAYSDWGGTWGENATLPGAVQWWVGWKQYCRACTPVPVYTTRRWRFHFVANYEPDPYPPHYLLPVSVTAYGTGPNGASATVRITEPWANG